MDKVCWKPEFSIGIESIDRQHQHMFEIINKFIERPISPDDSDFVPQTLKEMAIYAKEHFTDEEKLMQDYGYPEIEPHRWQHAYFIESTAEFFTKYMRNKQPTADEIATFLNLWLTTHILKSDMEYRDYFKAKELSAIEDNCF